MKFSSENRTKTLTQLTNEKLDILVIGGGITGAGIALEAASRGLKVGLVEMQDYAAGTSSRSTKLIHGGLRYLKQFEIKLVADVGKERAIVYENGPHVTTPEWMMLPFYKGGTFGPFSTNIGLRVYDFLAGVKKSERRKMFSPAEALEKEPLLQKTNLKGAGYYVEYKTDDARLTIEVLKKAIELGAKAVNYTEVTEFIYEAGKVKGLKVTDQINGENHELLANKIINATGPWVDELREKDNSKKGKTLFLTKGIHLVFKQEVFPLQQAIYFDTPDKRMIFAIPRGDKTYVGTTDTAYETDPTHPDTTEDDSRYLLDAINQMFPELDLSQADVDSSWAGVRPLIYEEGKDPSEISRKDEVFISESGLYSMAGGKLTGYRKMGEGVVNSVIRELANETGTEYPKSDTVHLPISGGDVGGSAGFIKFKQETLVISESLGITKAVADKLIQLYGSNVDIVFDIYHANEAKATEKQIDPILLAKVIYAIDYEQAYKPIDYFMRRTGELFFDIDAVEQEMAHVIQIMKQKLNWDDAQTELYEKELIKHIDEAQMNVK